MKIANLFKYGLDKMVKQDYYPPPPPPPPPQKLQLYNAVINPFYCIGQNVDFE